MEILSNFRLNATLQYSNRLWQRQHIHKKNILKERQLTTTTKTNKNHPAFMMEKSTKSKYILNLVLMKMFLLCINWINRKKKLRKKTNEKKKKLVVSGLHILAVWVGGWWKSYQKCSTFAFGHLLHNDLHQAIWFDWYWTIFVQAFLHDSM